MACNLGGEPVELEKIEEEKKAQRAKRWPSTNTVFVTRLPVHVAYLDKHRRVPNPRHSHRVGHPVARDSI